MPEDALGELRVFGSEVSYFTGKLEAYLRYKEIPYRRVGRPPVAVPGLGVGQIPTVELADGRQLTDTTPILVWLETRRPEPAVLPRDPLQAFFSRLLEDYADEWLWRPAMHYRWDYAEDRALLASKLTRELLGGVRAPAFAKRILVARRQRRLFTRGDGVDGTTWQHVESIYRNTLTHLGAVFAQRPFLLGDLPTLADFGFFGSMFRHFGQDPTPSTIMRETAPAVYAWVARLWNARASRTRGVLVPGVPDDWGPLLDAVGDAYLPYLCANAEAWRRRDRRFDVEIQGARYRRIRTSRYRVWCLEQLRTHYDALPAAEREAARTRLETHGCWEALWRVPEPTSGIDPEGRAPFAPGHSMTGLGGL